MAGKVDLFAFAHRHRDEVVWMSQNTNTVPLDPKIQEAVVASAREGEYHLYPYKPGIFGLPEAIREDLRMEDAEVFLTNGGIEALYAAQRAMLQAGNEVVATDPSFLPIHRQTAMAGAMVREVPVYGEPWKLTPEAVQGALSPRTKILLVIDPHNPLGSGYTADELRSLAQVAEDADLVLFHDITYRDFSEGHVLASEFYHEGTLLFYSFSKGAGLAGMRVGALVGPKALVDRVASFDTNILGVNVLAQRAALTSLRTKAGWLPRLRQVCRENQETIHRAVEAVDGALLPVYPARGNMFIVDVQETGVDPAALEERMLLDHKVHVRQGYYLSPRFGQNFVRVSFSVPPEQCARFPEAFQASVEALRS